MTSDIVIRRATAQDVERFYAGPPKYRLRAFVAVQDEEPLGIAGVFYYKGSTVAFSEIKPELRKHRKVLAKGIRMMVEFMDAIDYPIFAIANQTEPTAPYLLTKLGFKPTGSFCELGEYLMREPR